MRKNYKNKFKHLLGESPLLFSMVYRILGAINERWVNRDLLFSGKSDVVIEGYPRSANTFAVVYFESTQEVKVNIAHHLHIEAQLIWAANNGVPGIVLIREPEDCIRSLVVREDTASVRDSLKRYIKFYTNLLPHRSKLVVGKFEDVTTDMSLIIEKCNQLYGSKFNVIKHTEIVENNVYREIEAINLRLDGGKETHVARPSKVRNKATLAVDFSGNEKLLSDAEAVYKRFTEGEGA
jgi:hypothetical protein